MATSCTHEPPPLIFVRSKRIAGSEAPGDWITRFSLLQIFFNELSVLEIFVANA
jgi:hypothetical protein